MSSDHGSTATASVADQAYTPKYSEAFPPLPAPEETTVQAGSVPVTINQWNNKLSMRRTTVTQVFCVPVEERRYKEIEQEFGYGQAKIGQDIMTKFGVSIEMSSAKDKSLTVVITGKKDAVMKARKQVVQQLQTMAQVTVNIPKEHHRFLLGAKGQKLGDLENATSTRITVPRPNENSEAVTIQGSKEGVEKAKHEIQLISDEQAKLAFERLEIPKVYHPFVCGPDNQKVKALMEQTGAKISVPPPSVMKNEIVVSGEKEGVNLAKETIMMIYREKELKCQNVSVEVRKSQHKYVIGPKGSNLNEILATTGVSVEVPPLDAISETITLRGEQEKLGPALTMVYSKANSILMTEVEAVSWLHRFIIGRNGSNIRQLTAKFPKVHISFHDGNQKIEVEGPPEDVQNASTDLRQMITDLESRMQHVEIEVDQKYHKHIIGKQGSNVSRLKEETGVSIRIPSDDDENNRIIRIEGSPEGVAKAKEELLDMVNKMENEKSRDIMIEQRFHKTIIGQQGNKIKEIRERFNLVQIYFPDPSRRIDVVTLRGPRKDVDMCFKYLQALQQELVASNYVADVHIFKEFHKNIIGKSGVNIRKIRDETDTRIDLPAENSDSNTITITGKKQNVEQARQRIEAIQKELANIKEETLEIPNRFHNSIIGAKGRLIRSVMEECGSVIIRFPQEGSNSDKVVVRGPRADVEKAKKQLQDLANERKESGHMVELRAKPEYHRFLIGRGGANVRQIREQTGARVIFPAQSDTEQDIVTIIGRQEAVETAKRELENRIRNLENVVEASIQVDPKFHRHFVVRRGEVLRHIAEEYGGVSVSFPRSGVQSDKVVLKGAKDCVEGAKKRILEIVTELEAQVTIECIILQKYHRTVMGPKGSKVQRITQEWEVSIKFPDRPSNQDVAGENAQVNGDTAAVTENGDGEGDAKPIKKWDIITINGKAENCEAAKQALLDNVPISVEVSVPVGYHRFVIGQRGREVRLMMEEYDVNISVPSQDENSDIIRITGAPANAKRAKNALLERVDKLDADKEDRMARSFQLELKVAAIHHPKIIGRKGTVISVIRQDNNVQIQFPDRNSADKETIVITGYEKDAGQARDDIMAIVDELLKMVSEEVDIDHRIHPRIIGARGRNVRKIMDSFKVDIRFPRSEGENKNQVTITGMEDNVLDCKEHLLDMEEEFMQDINDQESMAQYMKPVHQDRREDKPRDKGFVCSEAPWASPAAGGGDTRNPPSPYYAPDTSSTADFPAFGESNAPRSATAAWGPARKK